MKQCSFCFEIKPDNEYGPKNGRCNRCRTELKRHKRLKDRGKKAPVPTHLLRPMNYAIHLFKSYDGHLLNFPVRELYHTRISPHACTLVKRDDGKDWVLVQSFSESREILFDTMGPLSFLTMLREAGLELVIPGDFDGQV